MSDLKTNVLYYGDNLEILRNHIPDESIDLIYLDPPFNSKRQYNIIYRETTGLESEAQIRAFTDTWTWDQSAEKTYHEIVTTAPAKVVDIISSMRSGIGSNDATAYLVMMTIRLLEFHRVLKSGGALFLHCDPSAGHYLKVVMDQVFGPRNFQNEIIWHYRGGGVSPRRFGRRHDTIFFYAKGEGWTFNVDPVREAYSEDTLERTRYKAKSFRGDKVYDAWEPHPLGKHPDDVWDIQPVMPSAKERLSYPTQKPLALLKRIILAASNEGDVVLDPFCGCGTAIIAAHELNRRWIGIDITHLAISLMRYRLQDSFPGVAFEVAGEPVDLAGAGALAELDRYQFQWWADSLVGAVPLDEAKKKGADRDIDGVISFLHDRQGKTARAIVQVTSGKPNAKHFGSFLNRAKENAIGIYVTLVKPTRNMIRDAVSEGYYHSELWDRDYPRIQVLTIEELLRGKLPDLPPSTYPGYAKAQKIQQKEGKQEALL